jgi:hypothetical protein
MTLTDAPKKITAKRQAVIDRVRCAFVGSDGWVFVPGAGFTVRWSQQRDTPGWVLAAGTTYWGQETYSQHVFVTLIGRQDSFKCLIRICAAPWAVARDQEVTLARALEILDAPANVL